MFETGTSRRWRVSRTALVLAHSTSATFTFSATDPLSGGVASGVNHTECMLDAGSWLNCTSPQTYSGLAEGSHTFKVRAVDNAGNIESTPASLQLGDRHDRPERRDHVPGQRRRLERSQLGSWAAPPPVTSAAPRVTRIRDCNPLS